jgi:hypothetical protein
MKTDGKFRPLGETAVLPLAALVSLDLSLYLVLPFKVESCIILFSGRPSLYFPFRKIQAKTK